MTNPPYDGLALEITYVTDLGLAMLIAESEDGYYGTVAVVANVRDGRESISKPHFPSRSYPISSKVRPSASS
jgi:surface antigen